MMLGVVVRRSPGFVRRAGAISATTSVAAALVYTSNNKSLTKLDSSSLAPSQENNVVGSLVIPTLEAVLRAARLCHTASLMIMDYEVAKVKDKLLALQEHDDEDRRLLHEERERLQEELAVAQVEYTREDKKEAIDKMTASDRKEKKRQKEAMHAIAEKLANTEEQLAVMGDRKRDVHHKAATRLLQLCQKNGGVYIKVAQHLANLDYLIPQEYISVLSSLFDTAPKSEYKDVCQVIQEDLGKHPEELFDSFEMEPIASASLAQVHVAHERETGRKLAIKVQHRGLRETSAGDLFALTTVVGIVKFLFKDFSFGWVCDEIAPQLPIELDFCNEGKNAERAAQHIKEVGLACVVPKVLWNHSSSRVLVMEFEEGNKATDLEAIERAGLKRCDVARLISSIFNSQVFLSGFVHCDPHPANVLIRAKHGKPEVVLVDHGLYKQIDDDFRIRYANLWKSLMLADLNGIHEACKSLGVDEMYTLLAGMLTSRPYDEIMERAKTGSLSAKDAKVGSKSDNAIIQGYAQQYLQDIVDILGTLPRQMLLLLKMNDCLRHIDYALGSPMNTLVVAGAYASRATYNEDTNNPSRLHRIRAWLDYMQVTLRIQLHDVAVWWMEEE